MVSQRLLIGMRDHDTRNTRNWRCTPRPSSARSRHLLACRSDRIIKCAMRYERLWQSVRPRHSTSERSISRQQVDVPGHRVGSRSASIASTIRLSERGSGSAPTGPAGQSRQQPAFPLSPQRRGCRRSGAVGTEVTDPDERRRVFSTVVAEFNARHDASNPGPKAILSEWAAQSPPAKVRFVDDN